MTILTIIWVSRRGSFKPGFAQTCSTFSKKKWKTWSHQKIDTTIDFFLKENRYFFLNKLPFSLLWCVFTYGFFPSSFQFIVWFSSGFHVVFKIFITICHFSWSGGRGGGQRGEKREYRSLKRNTLCPVYLSHQINQCKIKIPHQFDCSIRPSAVKTER